MQVTRRATLAVSAALPSALARPSPAAKPSPGGSATPAAPTTLPPPAAALDTPLFGAETWVLPNGLTVAFMANRRAPVVAHYLFYAAGAGEDPAGRSGTAHLLEHMMFKGSAQVEPGALSLAVAREGGQDNAFTSRDVTAYFQHVEASRLPLVMRMEADRFAGPRLPAALLEPERSVVLEERRSRTDTNPRALFQEALEAALWGRQHWHGRPIIGWEEDIRAISRDDLHDFWQARYAPANATLVVVGDTTREEVARLADEYYGVVPARSAARRDRAAPPASVPEPRLVRHDPAVREALMVRSIIAPSEGWQPAGPTPSPVIPAPALDVLAHLLGGGQGSRMHRALVESGIAVGAGCGYDGDTPAASTFGFYVSPQPGIDTAKAEAALDATVDQLLQHGPSEEEVARAIRQLTAGSLLALDSLGAAPRMIGATLALGQPLYFVEYWPRRLASVTTAQVAAAAQAVLGVAARTQACTGWLLPAQA